jgi:hypothetical protein
VGRDVPSVWKLGSSRFGKVQRLRFVFATAEADKDKGGTKGYEDAADNHVEAAAIAIRPALVQRPLTKLRATPTTAMTHTAEATRSITFDAHRPNRSVIVPPPNRP